jgi:hypothetical protein
MGQKEKAAMAMQPKDMIAALGVPSSGGTTKPAKKKGTYLDTKPAQLRSYLEDATDSSLSAEARAEALCRAIEFSGEEPAEEPIDSLPLPDEDY